MKVKLTLILFNIFFSINLIGQVSISNYLGDYISYKWFDLPVTSRLYPKADSFLLKKMQINPNLFILFSDNLKDVKYELRRVEQIEFFREFREFDYRVFKINSDTVMVLRVVSPSYNFKPPVDIVLNGSSYITEFNGYFYCFKRSEKKQIKTTKTQKKSFLPLIEVSR